MFIYIHTKSKTYINYSTHFELAEDERLPDELRLYERLYDDDLEPEREDPENELSKQNFDITFNKKFDK